MEFKLSDNSGRIGLLGAFLNTWMFCLSFLSFTPVTLAIFCFLASSCGTLSGGYQIVSFDTTTDEVKVYDLKNDPGPDHFEQYLLNCKNKKNCGATLIGTTPFFHKVERKFQLSFLLQKDGLEQLFYPKASIRLKEAVFPDLALGAFVFVYPPLVSLAVVALTVDLISGSIFEFIPRYVVNFPDKYNEKYSMARAPINQSKAIYVVFPFPHRNKEISKIYTDRWKRVNKLVLEKQYKSFYYIDSSFVQKRCDMYGVEYDESIDLSSFKPNQLLEIGYLTDATHFVFLEQQNSKIVSHIVDAHSLQEYYDYVKTSDILLSLRQQQQLSQDKLYFKLKSFLPNGILVGYSFKKPDIQASSTYLYDISEDHSGTLENLVFDSKKDASSGKFKPSTILSALSLMNVDHSKQYGMMDFSFAFHFNIHFIVADFLYKYKSKLSNFNHSIRFKYFSTLLLNNLGPVLHTSLGAFSFLLSYGVNLASVKASGIYDGMMVNFLYGPMISWTEFVSNNLFLFADFKSLSSISNSLKHKTGIFGNKSHRILRLGVGYYFGSVVRNLTDKLF